MIDSHTRKPAMPAALVLAAVCFVTHVWVHKRQDAAYMDELFHAPQAKEFCSALKELRVPKYDPAITTPPLVYVISALLSPIIGCEIRALRIQAAIAVIAVGFLVRCILRALGLGSEESETVALAMATHPPLLQAGALYYTDAFGLAALLGSWALALRGRQLASAAVGIAAVFVRQTNVAWHAFAAAHVLWVQGLRNAVPHMAAGVLYVGLFLLNGAQIAIGHQAQHTPMLHAAQANYFVAYRATFAAPFALLMVLRFRSRRVPFLLLAGIFASLAVSYTGSYAHSFSLADNRHYVFYLYRRLLLRGAWVRYGLVPAYAIACVLPFVVDSAEDGRAQGKSWRTHHAVTYVVLQMLALGATLVTVLPSPLFEPRYFIPGYMVTMSLALARLRNRAICVGLTVFNLLVHFAMVFIFAEMPFERTPDAHMPNDLSKGRFML